MNGYMKLTAALAAFALLVVMGLSTQNTVQAQAGAPDEDYVCSSSQGGCTLHSRTGANAADPAEPTNGAPTGTDTGDNLFTIGAVSGATATIHNLDLPRVTQKIRTSTDAAVTTTIDGPDATRRPSRLTPTQIIEAVHKSSGLVDGRCDINGAGTNDNAYEATECGGTAQNYQVKAFNGNRIQVSYTPSGGTFAVIERR